MERGLRGCPRIELSGVHNKGDTMLYSEMTDKIINSFYKVYNILGYGFLEKVYENALVIEFKKKVQVLRLFSYIFKKS
jgi:hypothetical protein